MPVTTTTPPPMAHMGDRLDLLLRELGWTQSHLARQLGWSRQRVSQKFGVEKWGTDTIWAIAQITGAPTDYFFRSTCILPSKVILK